MFTVIDPGDGGILPVGGEMSREDCAEAVWAGMLHIGARLHDDDGYQWFVGDDDGERLIYRRPRPDHPYQQLLQFAATQRRLYLRMAL